MLQHCSTSFWKQTNIKFSLIRVRHLVPQWGPVSLVVVRWTANWWTPGLIPAACWDKLGSMLDGCFILYHKCTSSRLLCWFPCLFAWIPWNLSFRYVLFHEIRLQKMLWHRNARVNSHQRWKQTRFRVCFHLWCELTSTMKVTEWQVSWNSCGTLDTLDS